MSPIADRYRHLAADLTRRVEAVPRGRWDAPSPCAGWTARDVLRHVVDSQRSMVGKVGLTLEPGPSVDDDPVGAWASTRDGIQAVLDDPARAGLEYDSFFGRTTLEQTIDGFASFDLLVHSWDIARATGGDEALDPAEVARVHADARKLGENLRMQGVCGPEVAVPPDADGQSKLLAYLGRTP